MAATAGNIVAIVFPTPVGACIYNVFPRFIVLYTLTTSSLCPSLYSKGNSRFPIDSCLNCLCSNIKSVHFLNCFIRFSYHLFISSYEKSSANLFISSVSELQYVIWTVIFSRLCCVAYMYA